MFFYRLMKNPVTGETEKQFVKQTGNGEIIAFAGGPLFEQYEAWVAEGNEAEQWA